MSSALKAKKFSLAESKRELIRDEIRAEDRLFVRSQDGHIQGRILNINSSGALVELERSQLALTTGIGAAIYDLHLLVNDVITGQYPVAIVCHIREAGEKAIHVGLRFCATTPQDQHQQSERRYSRVRIRDNFLPVGHFNNPLVYNDIIQFKVLDISASGARISTSARNRRILRGQQIPDVELFFPTIGKALVEFKVEWVQKRLQKDLIECGITFLNAERGLNSLIAQYLLTFGLGDSEQLRKTVSETGVKTKQTKKAVTYDVVSCEDDYTQVLQLRHDAYARAGKVQSGESYRKMADRYDSHSHILIAKHLGKIVGSMRLTHHDGSESPFELCESIEVPGHFLSQHVLEASRACVAKDFEGTDLIHGMFEAGNQIAIKVGAEYVITSCELKLLHLYKRLGFKIHGKPFKLLTLGGIPHYFIAARVETIYNSKGLNPIIWHFSHRNVAVFLERLGYHKISLSPWRRVIHRFGVSLALGLTKFLRRK